MNLEHYTENMSTNLYTNAAKQVGCSIQVIDKEVGYTIVSYGKKHIDIIENLLSIYSHTIRALASNRYLSFKILDEQLGNLIPPFILVNAEELDEMRIRTFFNEFRSVSVIPSYGNDEKLIQIAPSNPEEIIDHIQKIHEENRKKRFIIQQSTSAKRHYSLITYEGQIIDVIEKKATNIVGDGINDIQSLINKKNELRESLDINSIILDPPFLENQGLDVSSIPQLGQIIFLNDLYSLNNGGDVTIYNANRLHDKYKDIADTVFRLMEFKLISIDITSDDLTEDPFLNNTVINGVSPTPMPIKQYFARLNEQDPLETIKIIFKKFFNIK